MYSSSKNTNHPSSLPPEVSEALDQESAQLGEELRRVWDLTGTALNSGTSSSTQEIDDMWANIQSKTSITTSPAIARSFREDRRPNKRIASTRMPRINMPRIQWLVPAFCVIILAGFAMYWSAPVTITADRGELSEAYLPDGSLIYLNSGSTVTYKRGFDGIPFVTASKREIELDGEGLFEVTHQGTPFIVHTFNASVEVLGTEFNVRAWSQEPDQESTISLVSGKVAVNKADAAGEPVILQEPGHTVVVRSEDTLPATPELQNVNSTISWLDRGLSIKGKTLIAVFNELERRYNISISVEDQQILDDSLTLLMPQPENIESILSDICIEKNLKFRKTSRGYVIYRP